MKRSVCAGGDNVRGVDPDREGPGGRGPRLVSWFFNYIVIDSLGAHYKK